MRLNELEKVGEVFYTTKYKKLYHSCDNHAFAYAVSRDELRTLRQYYVSTTWDPMINGVAGRWHCDFKFILAAGIVAEYGGFKVDFHATEVGTGKKVSLKEREIGIKTKVIAPLSQYLLGVQLNFPIISQKSLQWLLYDNPEHTGFLDQPKAKAPRAVAALHRVAVQWEKPITVGVDSRPLTEEERAFIKDVLQLSRRGGDFRRGMRDLSDRYNVTDHDGKVLDRITVMRRQMAKKIVGVMNRYYVGRQHNKVDVNNVREMIAGFVDVLGLGGNAKAIIMHAIETAGLFHPSIAPVDWTCIIRPMMDGDIEDTLQSIAWVGEDRGPRLKWYDDQPEFFGKATHVGTMMAG